MAFIKSKKLYAILMNSDEGKSIVKEAPNLSDEELQRKIDGFLGEQGSEENTNDNKKSVDEKKSYSKTEKSILGDKNNFSDYFDSKEKTAKKTKEEPHYEKIRNELRNHKEWLTNKDMTLGEVAYNLGMNIRKPYPVLLEALTKVLSEEEFRQK